MASECILLKGGGGGVSSDELTATKDRVLEGSTYVGKDTNDESGVGTIPIQASKQEPSHIIHSTKGDRLAIAFPIGYYGKTNATNVDGLPHVYVLYSKLAEVLGIEASKMLDTETIAGVQGSIPVQGAVTPSALNCGGSYTIPEGYHDGKGKVTANSLANQTSANANASHILLNQTAWINGSKITGTMPNNGTQNKTITPSASAQSYTIPAGYHNGSGKVSVPAVSNLKAEYIKKGVVVGGVTGTWSGYVASATDLYLRGNNVKGWTNRGACTFESGAIYVSNAGVSEGVISTLNMDLSAYTRFNVELMITYTSFYHNKAHLELDNTNGSNIYYKFVDIGNTLNTNVTASFDISTINQTIKTVALSFPGASTSSGTESSNSGPVLQVYRIWLS